ncbi:MAG: hypothetical protein NVS1B9_01220 [Solirubrobacteraceae bacterium]
MSYRAVCISATDGSAGEEVGRLVAAELGFRIVNEEVIARAAKRAGVQPGEIAEVERRKSFIRRMMEDLAPEFAGAGIAVGGGMVPAGEMTRWTDDLRAFVRTAIEDVAAEGEVVIVAHAASFALAGDIGALRVLVTASAGTRKQRLAQERGCDEEEASRQIKSGDTNRRDYLKRFYEVPAELPTHYDLVVNTDHLSAQVAAEVIARLVRS